jgi:hypothetical protein
MQGLGDDLLHPPGLLALLTLPGAVIVAVILVVVLVVWLSVIHPHAFQARAATGLYHVREHAPVRQKRIIEG